MEVCKQLSTSRIVDTTANVSTPPTIQIERRHERPENKPVGDHVGGLTLGAIGAVLQLGYTFFATAFAQEDPGGRSVGEDMASDYAWGKRGGGTIR